VPSFGRFVRWPVPRGALLVPAAGSHPRGLPGRLVRLPLWVGLDQAQDMVIDKAVSRLREPALLR